jgi:ZIP family zinc transporter
MQALEVLAEVHPVWQALLATMFTWFTTLIGAVPVFFTKKVNPKMMDGLLGMAAGIMIAASFWSLLDPAITLSVEMGYPGWGPPLVGFLAGGAALWGIDRVLPHLHPGLAMSDAEGVPTSWRRSTLLVLAITIHNIPEGLAVGVAVGAAAAGIPGATVAGALAVTLGIGLQNLPEGAAVALPLRREGLSRTKSFMYGQLSGMVEPVAGVLGAAVVIMMRSLLPYALAFAAGAMIYVVAEELIPEAQRRGDTDIPTIGVMVGFAIMMFLDVSLG